MDDVVLRFVIVVALGLAAAMAAVTARRTAQPVHPELDLSGSDLPLGVVLFTSTDCDNCREARAALQAAGVDFREVTWELEGRSMDSIGIEAVPLAIFRRSDGATVAQIAGVPRPRALRRATALLGS